jgi:hypothetical protein
MMRSISQVDRKSLRSKVDDLVQCSPLFADEPALNTLSCGAGSIEPPTERLY